MEDGPRLAGGRGGRGFSEDRWRTILELAEHVASLPAHERSASLTAAGIEPDESAEVLALAERFDETTDVPEPEVRVGTTVGRFEITGLLGSGGMGDVYAARDTELDRPVALKFLRPEVLHFKDGLQRFIREAQTASSLNHANIVTIHEIVKTGSTIAIVMELLDGTSLRAACGDTQKKDFAQILHIGEQIAAALAAAHSRGVVHRDIKPENVFLQADGRVKVLDFGLARQLSGTSCSSSFYPAGTLRYLSPEQARGDVAGSASDIFALGIVLHEMAAGRHPFSADSPFETVHAILNRDHERLTGDPRVSRPFATLVAAMLSKDPTLRPAAGEVVERLRQMRRELEAVPPGTTPPGRGPVVAVVVALGILGAWGAWTKLRPVAGTDFRDLRIRPLTSQPGWEADPALSPDGKYVAFTWSPHPDRSELYVKHVDGGEAVKLSAPDVEHVGPMAWSPDGKRIAWKVQQLGLPGEIRTVSATGGPATTVLPLSNANFSSALDWSPDGRLLLFSDQPPGSSQLAVYSFNLETGEKIKLTTPPTGTWGDWSPTFSPDGKTIAFKRVTGFWLDEIYLVPAAGGEARQITFVKAGIWGHAWTSSGDGLIVSCQRGSTILGIWKFPLADPSKPERIQQGPVDLITPATARKSGRIAWVSRVWDTNIYRSPASGQGSPVRLITSTHRDQNPAVAPDGRIAFVSDRSGSREIWIAAADGSGQARVTSLGGPPVDSLMWSPNGRQLLFESRLHGQTGIFTVECPPEVRHCGEPKSQIPGGVMPSWSADGTAIFYTANAGGNRPLRRHLLNGGADIDITSSGGYFVRQTRDGNWLYLSSSANETIYRMANPSPGGTASQALERVIDKAVRVLPFGWDMGPAELMFLEMPGNENRWTIRALSTATLQSRFVSNWGDSYPGVEGMFLSVSRDGKWVYYPRLDSYSSSVMVAERER